MPGIQGILPPHIAEHLAKQRPHVFARALRHDAGVRHGREVISSASSTGDIEVLDAAGTWDATPDEFAADDLGQAVRVREMARWTSALLGTVDVPDGVVRYGEDYANAFYDGRHLVFGMGDGEVFKDFTLSLDVFAHEFGHKIVDAGPGLEYAGQPGALNEHIADVMGVCVRYSRSGDGGDPAAVNWRIGDDLFIDGVSALRDMKNPGTAYNNGLLGRDPQVGHMQHYVQTFKDNGGVHLNSGIPNQAFVNFTEAYAGPVDQEPLKIWLRALAMSGPLTDFHYFAQACVETAGTYASAVRKAWNDVGVV